MTYGFGAGFGAVVAMKSVKAVKPKKKYTKSQLIAMTKEEQIEILKSLGVTKIPRREVDRVKKILELI